MQMTLQAPQSEEMDETRMPTRMAARCRSTKHTSFHRPQQPFDKAVLCHHRPSES
jgi:hypothetical protein